MIITTNDNNTSWKILCTHKHLNLLNKHTVASMCVHNPNTHTHTHTQTHTKTNKNKHKHRYTQTQTHKHKRTHTNTDTHKHRHTKTHTHTLGGKTCLWKRQSGGQALLGFIHHCGLPPLHPLHPSHYYTITLSHTSLPYTLPLSAGRGWTLYLTFLFLTS